MALSREFILKDERSAQALWKFLKYNWQALAKHDKPLLVTISEWKAKRSNEQNRRYFALLDEIAASAWIDGKQYSRDAWHEYFKQRFIGCEDIPGGGDVGLSTALLSVTEFSDYSTKVEQYSIDELGIEFTTMRS